MNSGSRITTEVCCASVQDCMVAQQYGAGRIELVSAHVLGGLTPSAGTIYKVKNSVAIPVQVIIRPRMSGFCYTQEEFELMCLDANIALEHGADGIVFGFLTPTGALDYDKTAQMLEVIGAHDSVFHRAIDISSDPLKTAEQLVSLGVTRILTSGARQSAGDGVRLLKQLQEQYGHQIEILAGGGINKDNVTQIIAQTGVRQVHFGATAYQDDASATRNSGINFGAAAVPPNQSYVAVSQTKVQQIIQRVDACHADH